ncbi:hypothetical protein [Oceanimonas baumannii]|uniref:Uncharacterized protein n=1 Tax=Oceanimonas baumannii TaxID=129578 RepID=A0A235CKT3_9GAMM|nr:hypothetical protein [Oceanimonas baumannii]MCC4263890.1 hypothetical protein [Oceanimonas baumannii]OYD25150.1 hypothetical protein B6S09_05550 [Oceanimonas baumannii]TDW62565.1 hypothetical protein LY04_00639 [Oceanimonas baumannii]
MAYINIDGKKYEKELIELARAHTTGRGEGKISKEEAAELLKSANDGQSVTTTERETLSYIRENFPFTEAAASFFDAEMSKL